jgi:hypothetical protein
MCTSFTAYNSFIFLSSPALFLLIQPVDVILTHSLGWNDLGPYFAWALGEALKLAGTNVLSTLWSAHCTLQLPSAQDIPLLTCDFF